MKFIADVHLGKLAKLLRMLGFDTLYDNSVSNKDLISIAVEENRILLSRNNSLKNISELRSFIIADEHSEAQLKQVLQHFNLKDQLHPFTRCIICNSMLQSVSKNDIISQLPQNTALYYNEFWQCNNCKRIYWKGSHYERMKKLIEEIENELPE
jgi:uncharacterized protein with PIN domain